MNRYGDRYSECQHFVRYCKELNIATTPRELEYYEQVGAMLPTARIVYPDDYVIARTQATHRGTWQHQELDCWSEIERLWDKPQIFPEDYETLTDSELVDSFDREMATNIYLHRPTTDNFIPWERYSVYVPDIVDEPIRQTTAEHYYSYWQVHQLHFIQQYPDLYRNKGLLDRLPPEDPVRIFRPLVPSLDRLQEFDGKAHYFDFLSFWITVYTRDRSRTFAHPKNKGTYLSDSQFAIYKSRLTDIAGGVLTRFNVTEDELYDFMHSILSLHEQYSQDERHKLALELESDVAHLERVMELRTGQNLDLMSDELRDRYGLLTCRSFRLLHPAMKDLDYAAKLVVQITEECGSHISETYSVDWEIETDDITSMLKYCQQRDLGLLVTSLGGMVAVGYEEHRSRFRPVHRYTNLKNLLTSFEYLLKHVAENGSLSPARPTLYSVVREVMASEDWMPLFQAGSVSCDSTDSFFAKLDDLQSESSYRESLSGYWARAFLIACLSRNFAVHSYPDDERYFGDVFGVMLDAVVVAILYSWDLAKKNKWVDLTED